MVRFIDSIHGFGSRDKMKTKTFQSEMKTKIAKPYVLPLQIFGKIITLLENDLYEETRLKITAAPSLPGSPL